MRLSPSLLLVPSIGILLTTGAAARPACVVADDERVDLDRPEEWASALEDVRVLRLVGDSVEHAAPFHEARKQILDGAWDHGFRLFVVPAGLYEVDWAWERLRDGAPVEEAASVFYRVWREDAAFLELLAWLRDEASAGRPRALLGSMARFHATGKALYVAELAETLRAAGLPELAERTLTVLGREERLARSDAPRLAAAEDVVEAIRNAVGDRLSEEGLQHLDAFDCFLDLEAARGGFGEGGFECEASLFRRVAEARHPGRRVVRWQGRGEPDPEGTGGTHHMRWQLLPPAAPCPDGNERD